MTEFKRQQRDHEQRLLLVLLIGVFVIADMYVAAELGLAIALLVLWVVFLAIIIGSLLTVEDEPEHDPAYDELEARRTLRPHGGVDRVYAHARMRGEKW